jgi:phosphoribosylformimino-5-aminoimidazole carboxamide ribotide isomerase
MKVIPAIDIIEGKTVRLQQGKYDKKTTYDMDPVDAARAWESLGAELIHVVDLDGARENYPVNFEKVREIVESVNVPVEVGGGFRQEKDIKKALDSGIWRVIIGSKALKDIDFAGDCIKTFKERIIISLDVEDKKLKVHGWQTSLDLDIFDLLRRLVSLGAEEVIYTDIARDGTLSGPNIEGLKEVLEQVDVKIISAGGIRDIGHVKQLKKLEPLGLSGVIIGRALYDGTIKLEEAIDVGKKNYSVS